MNGIKCPDMWSLKTCDNQPVEGVVDEEDDQDEDEIDLDKNFRKMSMMEGRNS